MAIRAGAVLLFAALSLSACASGGSVTGSVASPAPDLVLADVTVIDGTGGPAQPHRTIEVADGRITAIHPSSPDDAATIDVAGTFVTPGLMDAHVHLPEAGDDLRKALEGMLDSGITSVREMMRFRPELAGPIAGSGFARFPRVYWSAFWNGRTFLDDPRVRDWYARTGDVPWLMAVTGDTDLAGEARAARERGVTGIKTVSNLPPDVVARIGKVAHAEGLKYWSHAVVFPTRPSQVVASGVDVISHAAFFVWEVPQELPRTYNKPHPWNLFGPPAPYATTAYDDPAIVAVLDAMRARDVILDPTLTIMTLLDDEARTWAVNLTRLAHDKGIRIVTGTDTFLLFDEIEALVDDVGLTPLEAIASATSVGAATVGAERDFGTVEVGKVADLVVYPSDPSVDITALRHPSRVIKGGRVVR